MADEQNDFEKELLELKDKYNVSDEEYNKILEEFKKLQTSAEKETFIKDLKEKKENEYKEQLNKDGQSGNDKDPVTVDEDKKDDAPENEPFAQKEIETDEFNEHLIKNNLLDTYNKADEQGKKEIRDAYEQATHQQAMRPVKRMTVNEGDTPESSGDGNSDWKDMRRQAWKEYADTNNQPFEEISKAEDADLSMKVGDTPIHYQDESHLTMGNGEYEKFVKAVQIEKAAKTDIINFGNIQSEEYKQKLAAACIQEGMLMSGGPKSIDLSLDCFKNLDDATKAKIEEWNRAQEAREAAKEEKKSQEKTEDKGGIQPETGNGENEHTDSKNPVNDSQAASTEEEQGEQKPNYEEMFNKKVEDLKKEKAENPDYKLDMSQFENTADRVIAFAAAKTAGVKIDKLERKDSLRGKDAPEQKDANIIISKVRESLPDKKAQNYIRAHERSAFILRRKERKAQEANTQVEVDEVKTSEKHVKKLSQEQVNLMKKRLENHSR